MKCDFLLVERMELHTNKYCFIKVFASKRTLYIGITIIW